MTDIKQGLGDASGLGSRAPHEAPIGSSPKASIPIAGRRVLFAKVFEKDGNRFLTRLHIWDPEGTDLKSDIEGRAWWWAANTETALEDGWFEIPIQGNEMVFPHVVGEVYGRQFRHGGGTVFFIGGPLFDEAAQGIEAGTAETLGSVHESPVRQDAPEEGSRHSARKGE